MKFSDKTWRYIFSLGIVVFPVAAYFAGLKFVYYAWLNSYDPEKYPAEVVGIPAYSYLAVTLLCLGMLVTCIYKLIKSLTGE